MKQFNKDNLSNIYKLDPKLLDMFNETLKKYEPENQEKYFDLITLIDNDYNNLVKIPYTNYLYEMSKKPYYDFEALQEYHNAMLSINKENEYRDLYYLLKDNREVEDFVGNHMLENNIYLSAELYHIVDGDLKRNGMKSDYILIVDAISDDFDTYTQINDYYNGTYTYENGVEIFKEVYEDSFDIIDRYYFEELDIEE